MNRIVTSWESYSWDDRIFMLKHILKVASDEALGKKLGVSSRTILNWKTGASNPNNACKKLIKDIYEDYVLNTIKTNESPVTADFIAETSYDSMQHTIDSYLSNGNSMQTHCLLFAIASKLAADCTDNTAAVLIPRISCVYGAAPATIKLTIEDPSVSTKLITIKITHSDASPKSVLLFITMTKNHVVTRELGLVLNDEATSVLTTLINKFFNINEQHVSHKKHI